jgi:hypothetical protein
LLRLYGIAKVGDVLDHPLLGNDFSYEPPVAKNPDD